MPGSSRRRILRIDRHGRMETGTFDASNLWAWSYGMGHGVYGGTANRHTEPERYLDELKSVAACYGYSAKSVDYLLAQGFTTDEIEEFVYCGCGEA